MVREVRVGDVTIGGDGPLVLIGGPCVLEEEAVNLEIARTLKEITDKLGIPFIFKASYDKGNRGKAESYRGPMVQEGLDQLAMIRDEVNVPVLTDVHSEKEARQAAEVVDMLQIPAYLSMQTSLTLVAGATGKPVNVKKGQFLAPESVRGIVTKLEGVDNRNILLTERGTTFGFHDLVTDIRSLPIMRATGYPVCLDPTHIVRRPGIPSREPEGGTPEYVFHLTRAGVACGIDALFLETHPDPRGAKCDACSMLPLHHAEELLRQASELHRLVREWSLDPLQRGKHGYVL